MTPELKFRRPLFLKLTFRFAMTFNKIFITNDLKTNKRTTTKKPTSKTKNKICSSDDVKTMNGGHSKESKEQILLLKRYFEEFHYKV